VLFTNVTETSAVTWNLVNGVNINLNGHTYTLDNAGAIAAITDNAVAVECKISNGIIQRLKWNHTKIEWCRIWNMCSIYKCI
jgi:hypothetical protein